MRPASLLPSREGRLCPWASVTCLQFSQRLSPVPLRRGLSVCNWEREHGQHLSSEAPEPSGLRRIFHH